MRTSEEQKTIVFEAAVLLFLITGQHQTVSRVRRIPVNAAQSDAHGGVLGVVLLLFFRGVQLDKAPADRVHVVLLVLVPGFAVVPGAGAPTLGGKVIGEGRRSGTRIRVLVGVV